MKATNTIKFSSESYKDIRCTQASLESFGIYGVCPIHGMGVIEALAGAGYKYEYLNVNDTLKKFIDNNPTGSYVICTNNHNMSLIDGILTDTTLKASSRKITVIRVYK